MNSPTSITAIEEQMIRIRLSQILINENYKAGKFKIPVHLEMGHEAIIVAVSNSIGLNDKLILTHRNCGYNLARLGKLRPILDEYMLKTSGLAQGRLGSMNLINPSGNIIYSSSILANGFPVATGIALADSLAKKEAVTFVLGGDGSIEEGSFYESLTMMKTLGVAVVVLIENNEWSLATKVSERRCPIHLDKICEAINIPYSSYSGNDCKQYCQNIESARSQALKYSSPICLEFSVQTLGDYVSEPSSEHPTGKYINYHAGPSSKIDISHCKLGGILKESEADPIFNIFQRCGEAALLQISNKILSELQAELT